MTARLLELVEVVAGYDRPLTAPCSLSLDRGEVLGLYGDNGAGKSTLLNCIVGSARIHAGQVIRGPERGQALGLRHLPQRPVRPAEAPLSGHDLLRCMAAQALTPPPRLADRLDRRIDALSGGEYQLLCLWTCLAGDADLVLLDEPTNNLDPAHVDLAAEEILAERQRRGTLLVSHDPAFLERVCTRVVAIRARDAVAGV
jgi:ABC-2 type transport system ATP-binding protein